MQPATSPGQCFVCLLNASASNKRLSTPKALIDFLIRIPEPTICTYYTLQSTLWSLWDSLMPRSFPLEFSLLHCHRSLACIASLVRALLSVFSIFRAALNERMNEWRDVTLKIGNYFVLDSLFFFLWCFCSWWMVARSLRRWRINYVAS